MKRAIQKICALALGAVLAVFSCLPVFAAEPGQRTLSIATAAELRAFSRDCADEVYSQGLAVVLTRDIDLAGEEFPPIPLFCGSFDGGGHQISGLRVTAKGSDMGLFRKLTEGAVVQNLQVEGRVHPGGSGERVGLLAGCSDGLIENCTASGGVSGSAQVGGLVGKSGETGIILGCQNEALVEGEASTGGVCGFNEGTIQNSRNTGAINGHNNYTHTDTGGVAGRSPGRIEGCANLGVIGYEHNGYNVGGIAGLHSGVIVGCENAGAVLGRKDVGGIVGQFEPHLEKREGESTLDRLDRELDALSNVFREFSDALGDSVSGGMDDVSAVNDSLRGVRDTVGDAADAAFDDWEGTIDSIEAETRQLEKELEDLLRNAENMGDGVYRNIRRVRDAVKALRDALDAAAANADEALLAAIAELQEHLDAIDRALASAEEIVGRIIGKITQSPPLGISGELAELAATAAEIARHGAKAVETALGISSKLAAACGQTPGHVETLVREIGEEIANLSSDLHLFGGDATDNLQEINRLLSRLENALTNQADSTKTRLENTSDSLGEQLDGIQNQIDAIADSAAARSDELGDLTHRLVDQLDAVRGVLMDREEEAFAVDDISGQWNGAAERGSVVACRNAATITADYNGGGIAGMVAHELLEDPEADIDLSDTVMGNVTALVRATLWEVSNSGSVCVKNNYSGGIVGRADVGAVMDAVNTGSVETTDGDFCGGIAGASGHLIYRSHSMSTLTGNDFVGGIAGRGQDIQGCYAMAEIVSEGEKLGAIAGALAGEEKLPLPGDTLLGDVNDLSPRNLLAIGGEKEDPVVRGNYFLNEGLAGIDGVSYSGRAEPLSYEAFAGLEGMPEAFLRFGVTFVAEGKIIRQFPLAYGDSLPPSLIPPCPEKAGQAGYWPAFDAGSIRRNLVIEAEYLPWRTSISTGEAQPVLLAEGRFRDDGAVFAEEVAPEAALIPKGYALLEAYDFAVTNGGAPVTELLTIRLRATEGTQLLWLGGEDVQLLPTTRDGSYLVADMPGKGTVAVLVEKRPWHLLGASLCAAAAILLVAWWAVKKKKRKQGVASEQT